MIWVGWGEGGGEGRRVRQWGERGGREGEERERE